jgi:DNA-binding response OmpR family regulator
MGIQSTKSKVGLMMTVLVADDDPAMRSLISDELKDAGHLVLQVADGFEALASIRQIVPHLIITDLRMPHGGMSLIGKFKAIVPQAPILLMTAFGDKDTESLAYEWGASAYLNKPVRMEELKKTVKNLLDGNGHTTKVNSRQGG